MGYRLLEIMALFQEAFSGKRFVCCTLTVLYGTYNTVGQSIASIYNLDSIFTSGLILAIDLSTVLYVYMTYRCLTALNY